MLAPRMATVADTIAITALIVTGIVGLGAPALSAVFEARRERRRFDHEENLVVMGELRGILDEMAAMLDQVGKSTAGVSHAYYTRAEPDRTQAATQKWAEDREGFRVLRARLAIRTGADSSVTRACDTAVIALDVITRVIGDSKFTPDLTKHSDQEDAQERMSHMGEIDSARRQFDGATRTFLDEATQLVTVKRALEVT